MHSRARENSFLMLSRESTMQQCMGTQIVQPLQPRGAQKSRAGALLVHSQHKSSLGCKVDLARKCLSPKASSLALS